MICGKIVGLQKGLCMITVRGVRAGIFHVERVLGHLFCNTSLVLIDCLWHVKLTYTTAFCFDVPDPSFISRCKTRF